MAQKILFKRGSTVYADRTAAVTALNSLVFSDGEPVIVQYKSSAGVSAADRFLLAVGVGSGAGKYKLVGTYDDVNTLASAISALQTEVASVKTSLSTHVADANLHKTAADRDAISWVGRRDDYNVANGATSLTDAVNEAFSQIDDLIAGNIGVSVYSSDGTIDITQSASEYGLSVAVAPAGTDNILKKGANGFLEARIDLSYNSTSGDLTLKRGGLADKVINIPINSFLESGSYNAATEELWLITKNQDGSKSTIKIPVSSLITEWTANSTSTVTLSKTRSVAGQDVLTADVKKSATAGNALTINADGLFVADKTADITAANNNANSRVKTINVADSATMSATRSGDVVTIDILAVDGGTF